MTDLLAMLRAAWLRVELWELQRWIDDFGRDLRRNGLSDNEHLQHCRHRAQEIRAQLATLGWPIRSAA